MHSFITEQLGYEAVLSEFDSFPLEPEISTVENCIRVVRERADVFCLIVGGRYGSIGDSGKSITNLEYINARAKGIPIYVFVDKSILSILSVWEKNKSGDFSSVVDDPKLFEFVSELRGKDSIWVYGFEDAQDIITTLRKQLGFLFNDALIVRGKLRNNSLSVKMLEQTGKAIDYVLEKPIGWEYLLLGECLKQGVNKHEDYKRDLTYGFSFGNIQKLSSNEVVIAYATSKNETMLQFVANLNVLFNKAIPDAIGAPGEAGNEERIIYVGERFSAVYESLLSWGMEFKSIAVDEDWVGLINSVSKLWESPIADIDEYIKKYEDGMKDLQMHPEKYSIAEDGAATDTLDLSLKLTNLIRTSVSSGSYWTASQLESVSTQKVLAMQVLFVLL